MAALEQTPNWLEVTSLSIEQILKVLPHRYPFVMVDRVTEIRTGKPIGLNSSEAEVAEARKGTIARAFKNVTMNETQFQGHFPENPVFPGVLTLEALAQTGVFATIPFVAHMNGGKLPKLKVALLGFNDVRFRKPIIPGDRMDMSVEVVQVKSKIWVMQGKVEVDGKMAAEGGFLAQLLTEGTGIP